MLVPAGFANGKCAARFRHESGVQAESYLLQAAVSLIPHLLQSLEAWPQVLSNASMVLDENEYVSLSNRVGHYATSCHSATIDFKPEFEGRWCPTNQRNCSHDYCAITGFLFAKLTPHL